MYWFRIFYYDNSPDKYVKPLTCAAGHSLLVYATTPQQATDMAWPFILGYLKYDHHVAHIGTLSSAVHEDETARWQADHAC